MLVVLPTATSKKTCFFFFNDTATTEIYTLSLHDALPISRETLALTIVSRCTSTLREARSPIVGWGAGGALCAEAPGVLARDRKSTRLNSSHLVISYAVFCLKKKMILLSKTHVMANLLVSM